jgi:capsular polysaccharide biosynthesis protein
MKKLVLFLALLAIAVPAFARTEVIDVKVVSQKEADAIRQKNLNVDYSMNAYLKEMKAKQIKIIEEAPAPQEDYRLFK